MKNFKSHFWYNKRQRNGILFLVLLIVILQGTYFFTNSSSVKEMDSDISEIETYQQQIDSLKEIQLNKKEIKLYPFNPNYITDFKGYQLGMSLEEIDKLLEFRKTGKFVNSTKDFQKVTGISDSLLAVISPYFKFPDWVDQRSSKQNKTYTNKKITKANNNIIDHDINKVTANQLKKLNGIGDKLAKRIIAYRELLSGFTFNEQLYEVYYLNEETANLVLKFYWVIKKPLIKKKNINNATFKEVLHLPYLDYNLTKKIFNYHDENGDFSELKDLKKIDSFPIDKFQRIALYLTVD